MQFDLDLDHVTLDQHASNGTCTTASSQSMENENTMCEVLNFGCKIPTSLASEKLATADVSSIQHRLF